MTRLEQEQVGKEQLEQEIVAELARVYPHQDYARLRLMISIESIDVRYPFNGVEIIMIYEVNFLEYKIPPLFITKNMTELIRKEEIRNWIWWLERDGLGKPGV